MDTFRKVVSAKAVRFRVNYDDGRAAYLWVDNPTAAGDTKTIGLIAQARQEQGSRSGWAFFFSATLKRRSIRIVSRHDGSYSASDR
jgi:hypothetical protein